MRTFAMSSILVSLATAPSADGLSEQCQALFDDITADLSIDFAQCEPVIPSYTLANCDAPHSFNGDLPTTHLILAIDASGSMAGSIGGETKMAIAQREATEFLLSLDESISVGLMVYGHRGTNQESGRAESCASSEMVHGFDASRRDLEATIQSLTPTGWTPIGGVLEYSGDIIAQLPEPAGDNALAPVIYLISDGEETCQGDPVAAATQLYQEGVRTTVNTIGFAVDPVTQAQLEAVAEAGGGTFYPAETGGRLREQLRAIAEAELSVQQFAFCVQDNGNRIFRAFSDVSAESVRCYNRNSPHQLIPALMAAQNAAGSDDPLFQECSTRMIFHASDITTASGNFVAEVVYPFEDIGSRLINEHYVENGFPPLLTIIGE